MIFLKARPDRDGKIDFTARDRAPAPIGVKVEVVKVQLGYSLGGTNVFSGNRHSRGIFLRFSETTVERSEYGEMESFMIGSRHSGKWGSRSKSFLIEELPRGNPKRLAAWAEALDPVLEAAALAFRNSSDEDDTINTIRKLVEPVLLAKVARKPAKVKAPKARPEMKPLTKEVLDRLPALYANEEVPDPIVQAKFFTPDGGATWLATEFDGEDTFFGFANLGDVQNAELGYFSLSELKSVRGALGLPVELDRFFTPKPLSEAKAAMGCH